MPSTVRSFVLKPVLVALLAMVGAATHAGNVIAYTALEENEIAEYLAAAKKDMPDIDVKVLRLSTGDLGARVLAEAANPQHDVIWGWAVTNMLDSRITAMMEPYAAKGIDKLPKAYKASDNKWFAATGFMVAFCVNTEVLKAKHLPMPTSWKDLAKPVYKGEVVMPNPVSSGTGYLQIAAMLQSLGNEKGWDLLKAIDANVAQYSKSGSRPCKAARAGEYAIGASLAFAAIQSIEEGFPVKMVIPSDSAGYEIEASALMKTAKNKADAKRFLDWTLSPSAAALYGKYKEIVTAPGAPRSKAAQTAGLPADLSQVLYPMDFTLSAKERDAALAAWQKKIGR
ncbi:ABC transporter substrate-binding protein [Noviherbaspirillum saxi]|uniref:ABC transporter substrate-binding protein n=1 Tax=Noviherbaspirillum saxi TaxID=2320863 RepID=A0A3A3FHT5_9BURK|nr:ABC transporter substrate-binding protein [Noviherbaspirillum saxi]RJF92074.1 ABC transporter substrate-binding protein [Noviherbaspirillum saxi]